MAGPQRTVIEFDSHVLEPFERGSQGQSGKSAAEVLQRVASVHVVLHIEWEREKMSALQCREQLEKKQRGSGAEPSSFSMIGYSGWGMGELRRRGLLCRGCSTS